MAIVLSWDGVRPDYLSRVPLPALQRVARDGARAERLVPVFPTNTFPNHVALATGTHADRHGIVANSFWDRDRGSYHYSADASWIEAEPLWVAAERQGVRTAVFFWAGSETDWRGTGPSLRRAPFDGDVPESAKVDQILAWLDLPEGTRPRLIMSWWHGCDSVGHRLGPQHAEIARQLAAQDRELGRLLEGLDARDVWPRTTLFIVSDHGMAPVSEGIDPAELLAARGLSPSRYVPGGGVAHLFFGDAKAVARAREALESLGGVRVFAGDALPARLRAQHPKRTGDLVLLTDPPRAFVRREPSRPLPAGGHGYDPSRPEMSAIFLALGRGVPAGLNAGSPRTIDVAATVARVLEIEPPRDSEGAPIPGIGAGER